MKEEFKPTKVIKVHCPKCNELMIKIYPWSSITLNKGVGDYPLCKKCLSK